MTMQASFSGKTALITGASSGIGKAAAALLAESGANVILVARRADKLQEIAESLASKHKITATVIAKDLSEPNAAQQLYDEVQKQQLTVDVLVNNAGIGYQEEYLNTPLEDHHKVIQVNLIAVNDLSYLFAQDMVARGSGYILQVASFAGFISIPNFATYAASKAYVLALGEALADELGDKGVTVTTVCPGGTSTEFFEHSGQKIDGLRSLGMMTSEYVAKSGLRGLTRGHRTVVPGLLYKASVAGLRLIPRRLQAIFGQMATD